jgi:carbamate kinase
MEVEAELDAPCARIPQSGFVIRDELQAVVTAQILELLVEIVVPPGGVEIVDGNDNARNNDDKSAGIFFHEKTSEVERTGN